MGRVHWKFFPVALSDVGRPVGHVVSNLTGYDRLVADAQAVLDTLAPKEVEVQTTEGKSYTMYIRPYRTVENVIEGEVITFIDVTERKRMEAAMRKAQVFAESIVATVREPLVVLDENLKVVSASRSFYSTFRVEPDKTLGCVLYALGNRQWDIPALHRLLEDILPQNTTFDDFEITHEFEQIGRRTMLLNARRILGEPSETRLILLAIEDITGRRSSGPAG